MQAPQEVRELKKAALNAATAPPMVVEELPLELIKPNPYQVRKSYKNIKELAKSIDKRGLQNPISVIKLGDEYVIVSGHRRFQAFRSLHRKTIPAIIRRESTPADLAIDIAIENMQREDLTPIEVGETLMQLIYSIPSVQNNPSRALTLINQIKLVDKRGAVGVDFTGKYGFKAEDVPAAVKLLEIVGISANTAVSYIRILQLPEDIQEKVIQTNKGQTCSIPEGKLSVKTAYELTRITDPEMQRDLCEKILNEKLKYVDVKFMVDEIVENNGAVANRNLGAGTAARRVEDDAGTAELTEKLFRLSSTVWNFRVKLPLVCRRLDKVLWVASLNKMKKACLEMVHNINNLLREDMKLEGWLELVNADLEVRLTPASRPGENLRFSLPKELSEMLNLQAGDKLILKVEGIVRLVPEALDENKDPDRAFRPLGLNRLTKTIGDGEQIEQEHIDELEILERQEAS